MVTIGEILQRPIKGCFTTVHYEGQIVGEIEPSFYQEFKAEFGNVWRLFDKDGFQHQVMVDGEGVTPLITRGWTALREHYNFIGHHEIFFKYLGGNYFQIILNLTRITPVTFPTWHSLSRRLRKAVTFKMTMTEDEDPDVNPHLELPKEMAEYLAQTFLDQLFVVGLDVEPIECVLRYRSPPLVVKIVQGWPKVVRVHGFKVGDELTFTISNIYENYMIYVRKI